MPLSFVIAVTLTAAAVASAVYLCSSLSGVGEDPPGQEGARLRAVRDSSSTFRNLEPTIRMLAAGYRRSPAKVARLAHQLDMLGVPLWKAEELAATKQVEALLIALAASAGALVLFGPPVAVGLGLLIAGVFPALLLGAYKQRATEHVRQVRGRLPHALDLMALMLEAGAGTLRECLERADQEYAGQPLGQEFRRVLFGVEKGVPASETLRALDQRLGDPDVRDLVVSVNTAEERGIALKDAIRGLADRMRERRVQIMEKSAERAKVKITGPAVLTMAACLLIVVAPIVIVAVGKVAR